MDGITATIFASRTTIDLYRGPSASSPESALREFEPSGETESSRNGTTRSDTSRLGQTQVSRMTQV
jgi:hypothetical protein